MTTPDDARAAQAAVMSDPDRVQLLGLILSDPSGEARLDLLSAHGVDTAALASHLDAMVKVGLLSRAGDSLIPTHDALARFGSLAGDRSIDPVWDGGDHARLLRLITKGLVEKHRGTLTSETVQELVRDSYDLLASRARVRIHLPQLTERFASDRLQALVSVRTNDPRIRDDVLFVCVRNAGRSQIAAALMRSRAGGALRIRTAGSAPAADLDPVVRSELARLGIDGLTEFPHPLTDEVIRASGVVITMGCGDACPVLPGRRYEDWKVEDPMGRTAEEVRRIVAEISDRVRQLITELGIPDRPS